MLMGNSRGGAVTGDFRNADLPVVPRLVALGVHVHQGDFGATNVWLNTLFAAALIWLSATGLTSWWIRRPQRGLGIPPRVDRPITRGLKLSGLCLCLLLPLFGLSVLVLWLLDRCALAWSSSTNR